MGFARSGSAVRAFDRGNQCVLAAARARRGRFDLDDSVFHYTLADRTVQAIEPRERTSALVVTGVPDRELHVRAVRLRAMGVVLKADRLTGSLRPFAKSHNGG